MTLQKLSQQLDGAGRFRTRCRGAQGFAPALALAVVELKSFAPSIDSWTWDGSAFNMKPSDPAPGWLSRPTGNTDI